MKHIKTIAPLILLHLLTFCTSPNSVEKISVEEMITEISDTWSQVNADSLRLNDQNLNIRDVQLINDSIAEVQIINSSNDRKITGTWKFKLNKNNGLHIELKSNIDITNSLYDNHPYELLIRYCEENEKLINIPIVFVNEL